MHLISVYNLSLLDYHRFLKNFYSLLSNSNPKTLCTKDNRQSNYILVKNQQKIIFDCQINHFFKNKPDKAIVQNVNAYINKEIKQEFFRENKNFAYYQNVIWLENNDVLEIKKTKNFLVIISEKNLEIKGEGEIYGAIIINGKLTVADHIKLFFDLDLINKINTYVSNKYAEYSLRDY